MMMFTCEKCGKEFTEKRNLTQSVEVLTTYSAGQAVAVGRFMSVSVVWSTEHFAAYPTGIGLLYTVPESSLAFWVFDRP
jgi:hypothetical protein